MFKTNNKIYVEESNKQKKFNNINEKIKKIGSLKDNKLAYYSFLVATLLTVYFCSTFIGGAIGLLFNIKIDGAEFILFPFITMIFFLLFLKKEYERYYLLISIGTLVLYFAICFTLIYINTKIWDISSDSLVYHEPMIIALANGWNPIRDITFNHTLNIWDIHYPKANAIYATMIYKLTGNIESSKILSMLIPIISSFFTFSFIVSILKKRKKSTSIFLGIIGALMVLSNPVNIEQCLTFYVDSSLGGMIIILIIMIFYLIFFEDLNKYKFKVMIFIIPFIINIKFTGLIYCIGILGALFIFYLFYGDKYEIKSVFEFLFWMFIVSVFIIGFNPYITNIITNHSVFYPLIGSNSINIITPNTPKELLGKYNIIQYIQSLFANISGGLGSTGQVSHSLKELVSINSKVMNYYSVPDPRLRGLGILSFFIEPISFVLFIGLIIQMINKKINKFFVFIVVLLTIIIILIIIQIGSYWWARYIPFYWLLPSLVVIGSIENKNYIFKILGILLLIFMFINILLFIPTFKYKIKNSNNLKNMVFKGDNIIVKGEFGWKVMENKYKEFDIPYKLQKE